MDVRDWGKTPKMSLGFNNANYLRRSPTSDKADIPVIDYMTEIIDICTEVITDKILNLMDSDSGKLNRESWFFETYARGTNRILPSASPICPIDSSKSRVKATWPKAIQDSPGRIIRLMKMIQSTHMMIPLQGIVSI